MIRKREEKLRELKELDKELKDTNSIEYKQNEVPKAPAKPAKPVVTPKNINAAKGGVDSAHQAVSATSKTNDLVMIGFSI